MISKPHTAVLVKQTRRKKRDLFYLFWIDWVMHKHVSILIGIYCLSSVYVSLLAFESSSKSFFSKLFFRFSLLEWKKTTIFMLCLCELRVWELYAMFICSKYDLYSVLKRNTQRVYVHDRITCRNLMWIWVESDEKKERKPTHFENSTSSGFVNLSAKLWSETAEISREISPKPLL